MTWNYILLYGCVLKFQISHDLTLALHVNDKLPLKYIKYNSIKVNFTYCHPTSYFSWAVLMDIYMGIHVVDFCFPGLNLCIL